MIRNRCEIERATRNDAINNSKRAETCAPVFGMIVRKFGLAKLQIPRLDGLSDKAAKKVAERAINDLGLTVGLRMIGGTKIEACIDQTPQRTPKVAQEASIAI